MAKHEVRVASVQMRPTVGGKAGNLRRSVAHIGQAAERSASLIVLPELANTGHMFDGGLVGDDGPAHGHGSIVGAALGAALIVEERFEDH